MTILEMLGQSAIMTLLCMGIVLSFLTILVFVISQIGKLMTIKGFEEDMVVSASLAPAKVASSTQVDDSAQITAAITVAINEYKKST